MEKSPEHKIKQELQKEESRGPWFIDVPHEEYVKTRFRILRDESLGKEEKIEMMRLTDAQRANLLLSNDQYSDYVRTLSLTSIENALLEYVAKGVLNSFVKEGEYYNLQENSKVIIPGKFAVYGISGEITFDRIEISEEGARTYSFRINQEKSKGFGEEEYVGSMQVDVTNGTVKTVVLPESIDLTNPGSYNKYNQSLSSLLALPSVALRSVTHVPKINSVPYQDGRMENQKNERDNGPTSLYEEITSTLLYRRCTIKPGQGTDRIVDDLNRLMDGIPEEHKQILKQIGGGDIQLRLYFAHKHTDSVIKDALYYEHPVVLSATNIGEVISLIQKKEEFEHLVVLPNGSRVPRELDNLPPGPSPRHHTRRTRTKSIVVLGGDASAEIRKIQTLISAGGDISEQQFQDMADYTGLDIESVQKIWQENHRRVAKNTLITSDAKPLPDRSVNAKEPHLYKKAS